MARKYDEVLEAIENGELEGDEAVAELKRFSTSTLKEQAEKVPTLEKERDEWKTKAEKFEKAPVREQAFRDASIDFDSLRPLEREAIENYDGELSIDKVAAFIEEKGLPTVQGSITEPVELPAAAGVAAAARQAPSGKGQANVKIDPADLEKRMASGEISAEKWATFMEAHPEEAEMLMRNKTVVGLSI